MRVKILHLLLIVVFSLLKDVVEAFEEKGIKDAVSD